MYKILLALCLCTSAAFAQQTERFKAINTELLNTKSKTVLIAAHRGAHLDFPENSMAGFRQTIEIGTDIIELDVRCTKDGALVVMHDKTVNRTTNGTGNVSALTLAEIKALRLKHKGEVTNEQVPTLEEALLLAKGKIMVDLDIKTETCVDKIMETVKKTGTVDNTLFFLYDFHYGKPVKDAGFRTLVRTHSEAEVDTTFSLTKAEAIHIDDEHFTPAVVTKIKSNGARVWINALGNPDKQAAGGDFSGYDALIKGGATIIQTDQPALLKQYLQKKGLYY